MIMNGNLVNFFNGNLVPDSKISRILFSFSPISLRLKYIHKIIETNKKTKHENFSFIKKKLNINFEIGTNCFVRKMNALIIKDLSMDLIGAYIHGSLGTYEEIPYSDFDALVIIKDEIFEDKKRIVRVAKKMIKAKKIMYKFDPIQHHGWFIMTESDLKNYPQTYFPHELFEHAKSLFPDKGTKLEIYLNKNGYDYIQPFHNLANSIIRKIDSNKIPKNMFQLKSLLSEFMLLPALYIQARDKKGVYKKFSFDLARKDFPETEWEIINEVSEIRDNWHYKMGKIKRKIFIVTNPVYRKIVTRYLSPEIPTDINEKLIPEFYEKIKKLCVKMKEKI